MRTDRETIVVNIKDPRSNIAGSKQYYTRYIGRSTRFGNKHRLGFDGSREVVIAKHKKDFCTDLNLQELAWEVLRGEILGCSCKPEPCHGDTYVEYIKLRRKNDGKPMGLWRKEDIDDFCEEN